MTSSYGTRRPGTRRAAASTATAVLGLVLAVVGFGGGRYWRENHTTGSAARATVTITEVPTFSPLDPATSSPKAMAAPAPGRVAVPAAVAGAVGAALRAAGLGPSVHADVVDAATGTALFRRGSQHASPPASTAKLLVATAVLGTIGAQARITTRVVAGTKPGQVVLVGAGDPTLSAAADGTSSIYPDAARLSTLAARTKKAEPGITSVVVDASLYTGPLEAPGWAPEDVPSPYASAIQALVVDGGRPAGGGEVRSAEPAREAGRAFARLLGGSGITVTTGHAPAKARRLASVQSPVMVELIEQMLGESDNTIAEMLARRVALDEHQPLSFNGAVAGVSMALADLDIHPDATMYDGSGLSPRDRITPAALVQVVRAAVAGPHRALRQLIEALPVAAWAGTLADRYRSAGSAAGAGVVRAKTGTLTGVVTLAGVVTDAAGRLLVFAVMLDKVDPSGPQAAETALDDALAQLAACTCT